MTRIGCWMLGALGLGLVSVPASAQNAQCTLLSGPNIGQVIPVTINPAPPLNAPCQVGTNSGYISRTSSGVGVNTNATCRIAAAARVLDVPYQGNPAPPLAAPCQVGNLGGYVTKTSGPNSNPNAQCMVVSPNFSQSTPPPGTAVPFYASPPPPLDSPCKVGMDSGFISSTSRPGPAANAVCTITYNGATIPAPYYASPAPVLQSRCDVGNGFYGVITSTTPAWSAGSRPFDLVWITDSDGTVQESGIDANGRPLNPRWFPQIKDATDPKNNPNFRNSCRNGWESCSSQNPQGDGYTGPLGSVGVCNENDTVWPGHLNFQIVTYTGQLIYEDYSSTSGCMVNFNVEACGQDHDLNFGLTRQDYSGLTTVFTTYSKQDGWGDSSGPALHLEFNGDETSWFGSSWWQTFRNWAQSDNPRRGYGTVEGVPAVVTGLLGIDAVHEGYTELHPVFSMALHDSTDDPDIWTENQARQQQVEQHWHFFIRNWGNEGTCSHETHYWRGITNYKIQLPWAVMPGGASAAKVKFVGGEATPYYSGGNYFNTKPEYEVREGKWVVLTFFMPAVNAGWDGYITLEYTFPAGVKPEVRTRTQARTTPRAEKEVNWTQVLPRITDPAIKGRLPSLFPLPERPSVPANRTALPIVPAGQR